MIKYNTISFDAADTLFFIKEGLGEDRSSRGFFYSIWEPFSEENDSFNNKSIPFSFDNLPIKRK